MPTLRPGAGARTAIRHSPAALEAGMRGGPGLGWYSLKAPKLTQPGWEGQLRGGCARRTGERTAGRQDGDSFRADGPE